MLSLHFRKILKKGYPDGSGFVNYVATLEYSPITIFTINEVLREIQKDFPKATDEQVEGVLKFFEYIGRSPEITEISKDAMSKGNDVAKQKNQPILPKIKPWVNTEYVEYATSLEEKDVTVNMEYYQEFFDNIGTNKHNEVQYGAQEMYEFLDSAIQNILDKPETANAKSLLATANSKMQAWLDENVNK